MRSPRNFFKPLAMGAPAPVLDIPVKPSRMIHFFDPSNPKMLAKLPDLAKQSDILLGNLEDAIAADKKIDAREGLVKVGREVDLGDTPLWTRVNSLDSPWALDDITTLVAEIGDRLEVMMIPKVEGAWDIHYVDRLLAQLEGRHKIQRPILVHAILETALGVTNVEEICAASPRVQGVSFGPADLAASRRMKTTRVGGGHPAYLVRTDPDPTHPDAPRPTAQQDPWHYSIARMVDACAATGALPFYGPFGDIADAVGCEDQFRAAFLLGCVGAWSLHPSQIDIAKRVFSPPVDEVKFALRVLEAMPDGRGVLMLDGKMQDDATWKQCKVMVNLARMLAAKDKELAAAREELRDAAGLVDGLEELDLAAPDRQQRRAHALIAHGRLLGHLEAEEVLPEREAVLETADHEADVMDAAEHVRTRTRARDPRPTRRGCPGSAASAPAIAAWCPVLLHSASPRR